MEENRKQIREIIVGQITDALTAKLDEVTADRIDELGPMVALPALMGGGAIAASELAVGATFATIGAGLGAWWKSIRADEQERILGEVQSNRVEEAFAIYDALKGMGTDEAEVIRMLSSKSSADIQTDYAKVLVIMEEYDEGGLVTWLRDDGMDDQAEDLILRMAQGR